MSFNLGQKKLTKQDSTDFARPLDVYGQLLELGLKLMVV